MRVFGAAAVLMLLALPAYAQNPANQPKSQTEIAAEKAAERAYQRSLGNIPNQAPTDPWGTVRSGDAPKETTKTTPAKKSKTGSAAQ